MSNIKRNNLISECEILFDGLIYFKVLFFSNYDLSN